MSQDTNEQEQQGVSQPNSQEANEAQYRASDSETKAGGESVETPEVSRSLSRSLSANCQSLKKILGFEAILNRGSCPFCNVSK